MRDRQQHPRHGLRSLSAAARDLRDGPEGVVDRLHEIVFQTDAAGNWTYLNRAWTNLLGFSVEETLGRNFLEFVHPDEREATIAMFVGVISGGAPYCHHETRYLTVDGQFRWMELRAHLEYGIDGQVVGNTGTLFDITARREAEQLLADQTHVLELIAMGAPVPESMTALATLVASRTGGTVTVAMVDEEQGLDGRPDARGLPGVEAAEPHAAANGPLRLIAVAGPNGPLTESYSPAAGRAVAVEASDAAADTPHRLSVPIPSTGRIGVVGELTIRHDEPLTLDDRGMALVHRSTNLASIAIGRRLDEDHARRQSLRDPLTGLANRLLIEDRLEVALAAGRRAGDCVALLLVDLNRFKEVNDSFGHEAGDAALRHAAERIGSRLRASDTAGRLGGDEFAVILPAVRGGEYAERVARKLVEAVREPLVIGGASLRLEASIGIALFPGHGDDAATLFRRADVAMYRAKRMGTGHVLYDASRDEDEYLLLDLAAELRAAIESEQLSLVYQPKLDLRSGRVAGVEALVRWNHEIRGPLSPEHFVPLAERTGSIRALSQLVLRMALTESRRWWEAGFGIGVAVNLSAHDLHDPELPALIEQAMRLAGTDPSGLDLEITESAVMDDPEATIAMIEQLATLGVGCAIDDFGTGYSSLAYLKRLPARSLKIDRSFIRDMADDQRDVSIVRSAIDLGHTMGMQVVGEGVEDDVVRDMLDALGCDQAQGFGLARPMPVDALLTWLQEHADGVPAPA
ncbi:MAG: diguanylate cyclase/phosphodiesterase (GGDEF & EAL domains) with PAS/PAC sensor(s) [uncultured Thermoleophilia bacterium]|uniref:Diguanylate cyclase/phosphodiesterase (GGDEF & EAL domains) with PAS/PAC sensor(S) n=1 Tax=uncultured Thermoleophilia bacterium TaxID=1497501 RepID=A0A6J4TQ95_9ACTN|nr:MAG: diguanylate cyclase/phosphodiesterase (GGDEF & EAL domains) with PAS/PAC sensor(s) [uncultured Thermoleophilia bacterium]